MTAAALLRALIAADVDLWREGDRLRFRAPAGALTGDLRALVGEHRAALLALVPRVGTGGEPFGLTAVEIAEFRRLGVEVRVRSPKAGEFWLVPAYTAADRNEVTPEDAGKLLMLLEAFPGSELESFAWLRREDAARREP